MKIAKKILPFAIVIFFLFLVRTAIADNSCSGRIAQPALSSNPWTTILTLNPTWDADGLCEEPFSSGTGYKGIPQWVHHNIDLSSYAHKAVKVRFYFDTNDPLYNKFEGWYLDNIRVGDFFDDVESGNRGWNTEGSHENPSWHISNKRSEKTSSHSWLYQDEAYGSFQAGAIFDVCSDERNWGTLTSPTICLGSNPKLEFDTLWEIESVDPNAFDMMYVQVEEVGPGIAPNGLNVCNLEKGDIVMINASNLLNLAENKLYGGYWGHTGIFFGNGEVVESYPDSFWPVDTPGVVKRPIDQSGFWQAKDWVVLRLKEQYNHDKKSQAAEYAKNKIGSRYNWDFLDKEQTVSFYCTQLIWRAYKNQTVDLDSDASAVGFLKPMLKSMVTPDDIFYSNYLETAASLKGRRAVFYLASPAHFYITNPEGQHVGVDPETGQVVNEIPDVFYSGPDAEPEFIGIPNMEGEWSIQVVGVGSGNYTVLTEIVDPDNHQIQMIEGETKPGVIDEYQVTYPETTGEPIRLSKAMKKFKLSQTTLWHFNKQDGKTDEFFIAGEFTLPSGYSQADLASLATVILKRNSQSVKGGVTFETSPRIWKNKQRLAGDLEIDSMGIYWSSSKNHTQGKFFMRGKLDPSSLNSIDKQEEIMVALELPVAPADKAEVLIGKELVKFDVINLSKPEKPEGPAKPAKPQSPF